MEIKFKKAESPNFKVIEVREPLVEDLIKAERLAGSAEGLTFALTLVSLITTFDGQHLDVDDIKKLPMGFFLKLSQALNQIGLEELAKQLSSSQEKQTSDTKTSSE